MADLLDEGRPDAHERRGRRRHRHDPESHANGDDNTQADGNLQADSNLQADGNLQANGDLQANAEADAEPAAQAQAGSHAETKAPACSEAQAKPAVLDYTVVSGDTLRRIASKEKVAGGWKAVWNKNKERVPKPDDIYVGQKLDVR